MPDINVKLADLKLAGDFTVLHKPGAVLLSSYPLLVYAPLQESHGHPEFGAAHDPVRHGPLVRLECNGVPVADVAAKAAEVPDYDRLAGHFGCSKDHIVQAIAYASEVLNEKG